MSLRSASTRSDPSPTNSAPLHGRAKKGLLIALLALVAVVLLVRFVGGPVVAAIVNNKLEKMDGFRGHVETVKLALWRGGVEANGFKLYETEGSDDRPMLSFEEVDLRIAWGTLFRGKLGGELRIDNAELNVVQTELPDAEDAEETKQKIEEIKAQIPKWREALQKALPMEVSKFEVNNSTFRFIDKARQPNFEIVLEKVNLIASGLTNRKTDEEFPAKLEMNGVITGNGQLSVKLEANPMEERPTFAVQMELKEMDLRAWNEMMRAMAKVDVGSGVFDFFLEAKAQGGRYDGYAKPFFQDLNFNSASDKGESLGTRIKEAAADVVNEVLDNDPREKVATRVPFSGTFATNKVDVWTAVETLLRNAFVQALREGFDRGVLGG